MATTAREREPRASASVLAMWLVCAAPCACAPGAPAAGSPWLVTAPTAVPTATATAAASAAGEVPCPVPRPIGTLTLVPDGDALLTACAGEGACEQGESLVDVWSLASGSIERSLDAGREDVAAVDFGPDGWLVTVAHPHDGLASVRLFSASDWSLRHDTRLHCVTAARFDPTGTLLGLAGCDGMVGTVRLSDMQEARRPAAEAHVGDDSAAGLVFSNDGKWVLLDDATQGFQILDAATLKRKTGLAPAPATCSGLSRTHERYACALAGGPLTVLVTADPGNRPKTLLADPKLRCEALAWLDDRRFVASMSGSIRVFDTDGKGSWKSLDGAGGVQVSSMEADPRGAAVAISDLSGGVTVWDIATGARKQLHRRPRGSRGENEPPPTIEWSPNGDWLVAELADRLLVWDRAGVKVAEIRVPQSESWPDVTWISNGDVLAVLGSTVRLHRFTDGAEVVLSVVEQAGRRVGLAGSTSGAYSGPADLAHCVSPAVPAGRRIQKSRLLADFFAGLPLRGD